MLRISLHSFPSHCRVLVRWSAWSIPSGHVLTCLLSVKTASSTNLGRSRVNPCASAHWSGMSGCLANRTPNTGYEPNFHNYVNEEHAPINLPGSHRSFSCRDDATIISTTADPEGFPHSGASSSCMQTAASKVPKIL